MRRIGIVAPALIALVGVPEVAHACAVCFDGPGETRMAFLTTTAFLTLLPLGIVAGAGAWLRKRVRRAEIERGDTDPSDG